MSTQVLAPEVQAAIEEKRRQWGNFGVKAYTLESKLSGLATSIPWKEFIPTTIEQVAAAEDKIKELKRLQTTIKETRIADLKPLTDWAAKQIVHEQSLDQPISELTTACISIKKANETKQAEDRKKEEAVKKFRADTVAEFENAGVMAIRTINDMVLTAFNYALDKPPVDKNKYLTQVKKKLTAKSFTPAKPTHPEPEKQAILDEIWAKWSPEFYEQKYHETLNSKFSDFEIQLKDKEAAKQIAEEETRTSNAAAQENANNNVAAETIDIMASSSTVATHGVKDLKKSYAIDMPDSEETFKLIVKAFFALYPKAIKCIKVKLWFNLKVGQMGKALADLKTEDNALQIEGITFKEVSKL